MQKESSIVVITAGVPRELRDEVRQIALSNFHSQAAEVRRALVDHVERVRAHGRQIPVEALEVGGEARAHGRASATPEVVDPGDAARVEGTR
jgi:hypothetical protein